MAQTLIRTIRSPAGFPCLRRRTGESLPNSNSFLFASWRPFSGIPAPLRRIMLLDSNFLSKHFHPDMESRLFYYTSQKIPPMENTSKVSPVHGRAQGRLTHAFYALNRPIRLITRQKSLSEAKIYSFPVGIFFGRRGSASGSVLGRSMPELSLPKSIPSADLPGIHKALEATRHLIEMYRRQLGNEKSKRTLQRLDCRLLAVAFQLKQLETVENEGNWLVNMVSH